MPTIRAVFSRGPVVLLVLALGGAASAPAGGARGAVQVGDDSLLTLDRIFSSSELVAERLEPGRWVENDDAYLVAEPAGEGGTDLVSYDARSGRRAVVVPAARLATEGPGDRPVVGRSWSYAAGTYLLPVAPGTAGERRFLVLMPGAAKARALGGAAEKKPILVPRLSPRGDLAAYVRERSLVVEDLASGRIAPIAVAEKAHVVNGAAPGLYAGRNTTGFRWSPDGSRIAFLQFDTSGVKDFHVIDNTASRYSSVKSFKYVKPGDTLPAVRAGVVGAAGGPIAWISLPGDPRQHYITEIEWTPNPGEILVTRLNRLQNAAAVFLVDAATGAARHVLTDRDEAWVEPRRVRWLGGTHFTWVSERDGWRRVYRVSRDGSRMDALTPEGIDVLGVDAVDTRGGWLYFTASPENPTQRYLYRARLDGSGTGAGERVTPADMPGTHTYDFSPQGAWAHHTYSTIDTPPVTALVRFPAHETVRVLVDNAALRARLARLRKRPTEFFRVDIGGGVTLDGWMMRPHDFDERRRYPALFYVYGMPAAQTVLDRWEEGRPATRYLWHQMLTQRGYIVVSLDNRGTPAPRGRGWRKIIHRRHGVLPADDQAAAARALVERRPYIDPARIGVYGWSGGACVSLNLILRYPGVYSMAMAEAGLTDHRLYHAGFTERYLGLPEGHEEIYDHVAPLKLAANLRGDLLIVHGTGDTNVHYQSSEMMVNALIAAKKRFTMMAYPGRSHELTEGANTHYHLHDLYTTYLDDNLKRSP